MHLLNRLRNAGLAKRKSILSRSVTIQGEKVLKSTKVLINKTDSTEHARSEDKKSLQKAFKKLREL